MNPSSLSVLFFALTLSACETEALQQEGGFDAEAASGAGASTSDGSSVAPALAPRGPSTAIEVHAGCSETLMTQGFNDCDGEDLLGLEFVAAEDEDGDGVWRAGETLRLHMALFSTFEADADVGPWHGVHYPGALLQLPDGVSAPDSPGDNPDLEGRVAVNWWYLIDADESYAFSVDLVADEDIVQPTELLFTVASLMCSEDRSDEVYRCPTPSPLRVQVGG